MQTQLHFKQVALAFAAGAMTATLILTTNSWAMSPVKQGDATRVEREARTAAARAITMPPTEQRDMTY